MSVVTDPKTGLIDGPVQPRLEALSRAKGWYGWAGHVAPAVLDTVEFEYFALRNQCALLDISPMHKYRITGPQAGAMLNRMVTRDVTKLRVGRVAYVVWCDEEGMVIDDGTLFRLGESDYRLCCQEPMLAWLHDAAYGYEVALADESHTIAGLALQGPTSFAVLEKAGLDVAALRRFGIAETGGVTVSRTGFTGDLGYELWMGWDEALSVWDRLWAAGADHGLRAIGYSAVDIARIEAGFLTAGVDFQPVHATERLHRGHTPFELGLDWQVDFKKGHFNGRRALWPVRKTPRSRLLRVDVEGFKPPQGALVYHRKRRGVGHVSSGVYSPSAKRSIALAHVRMPWAGRVPADLWAEIYTREEGQWRTRMARLTPQTGPFYAPARARATPPARR